MSKAKLEPAQQAKVCARNRGGAPMTPREVLVAADALLADESKWTQRVFARNSKGNRVPPHSPRAVCWCSIGAVKKVSPDIQGAGGMLNKAAEQLGYLGVIVANDGADFHTVKQIFAIAIEKASE